MSRRSTGVKPEDELTEITKAEIVRVDGVLGPANGTPPLLMKALDGNPPVDVEAVLKAGHGPFTGSHSHPHPAFGDQGEDDTHEHEHSHDGDADHNHPHPVAKADDGDEKVDCPTCDGDGKIMAGKRDCPDCDGSGKVTPDKAADMKKAEMGLFAQFVSEHPGQSYDDFRKAQLSSAEMNDHPDKDFAYVEDGEKETIGGETFTKPRTKRHFLIHDKAHADNAAARIAQGVEFGEQAKPKVLAAQRKFGTEAVEKAVVALVEGASGLLDHLRGAGPVSKADGEEMAPGSPTWEAQDAAALRAAASQLADLRSRVATSRDREAQEDEPYDWDNASDLDCAVQALDCALGIVARLAFTEQVEAMKPDDMAKAGRRLSTKSIAAIKTARDHLTTLLGPDGEEPETTEEDDAVTKAELEAVVTNMSGAFEALTKALQAGTPHVPTSMPDPAGSQLDPASGDVAAEANRQSQPSNNGVSVDPSPDAPSLGAEPAGGLPSGAPTPTGAAAVPAGADMARAKSAETAPDANPSLVKSAAPIDPEVFAKSLLEPVMKSVKDEMAAQMAPLAAGLEAVTKQVEAIAAQPMPGGPLLKGAPGGQFDWVHARREAGAPALPEGSDPEQMAKALDQIEDPVTRRDIARMLAVRSHPVYRQQ